MSPWRGLSPLSHEDPWGLERWTGTVGFSAGASEIQQDEGMSLLEVPRFVPAHICLIQSLWAPASPFCVPRPCHRQEGDCSGPKELLGE